MESTARPQVDPITLLEDKLALHGAEGLVVTVAIYPHFQNRRFSLEFLEKQEAQFSGDAGSRRRTAQIHNEPMAFRIGG